MMRKCFLTKRVQAGDFWNEELEDIWKNVCKTEKQYLSFKVQSNEQLPWKNKLRNDYKSTQNLFDKKFRFFKRQHKKKDFEDLEQFSKNNPTQMWAKFKLLCDPPSTRAALEIVRADGSISNDIKEILERWYFLGLEKILRWFTMVNFMIKSNN